MYRIIIAMGFCLMLAGASEANTPPEVSNVVATQRAYLSLVDIYYDVLDADGDDVHVTFLYSLDGGVTWENECTTVSGDVGGGVSPGTGLQAVWDAGEDIPDYSSQEFIVRAYADDGGGGNSAWFALIPPVSVDMPVTFTMGSMVESDETPHQVTLTGRFYMAETEVTNAQYVAALQWAYDQEPSLVTASTSSVRDNLDGSTVELLDLDGFYCQISFNGSVFSTSYPTRPVVEVSWFGSVAYCDWLSLQDGLTRAYEHSTWSCNGGDPYSSLGYRLPTEAEWEFACRAGTMTPFSTGDCLDAGTDANYFGSNPYIGCPPGPNLGHTVDVGSYLANQWGLFDIHGNVEEWCNDYYVGYSGDETDPVGGETYFRKVLRGGSWNSGASTCRSANRSFNSNSDMNCCHGFRPVRSTQ